MASEMEMLNALLTCERLDEEARKAFEDMRGRLLSREQRNLTLRQKEWVERRYLKLELDADEGVLNLVSRGLVPRGREVETPAVLRNLPLKPPGRR